MAVDEALLNWVSAPGSSPVTYLRFFQWERPTLSLGFSQKASKVVDFDFCAANHIDVVRRITGGKAVLHDQEVTYSVVSNDKAFFPESDIAGTYERIALALQAGLQKLGVLTSLAPAGPPTLTGGRSSLACFAAANHFEILYQDRKLVGSAQRRTGGAFLQHGSILIDFDSALLNRVMGNRELDGTASKVTCLSQCLGFSPRIDRTIGCLRRGFEEVFQIKLEEACLEGRLLQSAEVLSHSKYSRLEWAAAPELP